MVDQTITNEKPESIKLTKNAKGDMQYEIKVSSEVLNNETLDRLKTIRDELEKEYFDAA